jgi:hypothetical protein
MLKKVKSTKDATVTITVELLTGELFKKADVYTSNEYTTNIWDGKDLICIPTHNIKWILYHNMEV